MDLKTFFEHFDTLAEAPNGIQRLRELILDVAVRGKLVPQDPEDEPAKLLIQKVSSIKKRHIESGCLPKKTLLPRSESEYPFELPRPWAWTSLGGILLKITDGTHHSPPNNSSGDYKYITAKNIKNEGIHLSNITYVSKEIHEAIYSRCDPEFGDVLYIKDGATTGITTINTLREPFSMLSSVALLKLPQELLNRYLLYVLRSPFFYRLIRDGMSGIAITRVTLTKLNKALIPLPPLAEQKRIVAKVDELMALCDALEAAQQSRNTLRQNLRASALDTLMNAPSDGELETAWAFVRDNWGLICDRAEDVEGLRQSIYKIAVQGKLANQTEPSQSAQELLKSVESEKANKIAQGLIKRTLEEPLDSDNFPFMIPDSWEWIRFGTIIFDIEAGISPQCQKRPREIDEWGVIKISAVSWGKFNPSENKALPKSLDPRPEFEIKQGDFIMSRANTSFLVGRSVVVERPTRKLLLNDKTLRVYFSENIEKRFFNIYNNSFFARQYFANTGTGTSDSMKNITREQIRNLPVPLPPLAEQKCIVAKVDELMKLCDQLEESLRQQQRWAKALAASAVSYLVA
ncbi:restriction endonuclease subunit S [filamentous cyanobacterium CCP3]|nr:restriction endonuclease subunit S [filamentous cyanobacterium CCP3]